jgi:hypothetical protein
VTVAQPSSVEHTDIFSAGYLFTYGISTGSEHSMRSAGSDQIVALSDLLLRI